MAETTPLDNQNVTKAKLEEIMKHYHHMFLPNQPIRLPKIDRLYIRKHTPKIVKKPLFNYGLFDSRDSPKVSVINIKPTIITTLNKPLRLAPSALPSNPKLRITSLHNDGVFRSNPYWLHDRIAQAHLRTSAPLIPTSTSRPVTTTAKILPPLPTNFEEPLDPLRMIKSDK